MIASMITTLHEMEHHIRMTFGDLGISVLQAIWNAPIAGIGQGNGAGPQIRAVMSSPMLDLMHTDGFYAHMIASISKLEKKLVGFAFVDDMDLCIYGPQVQQNNGIDQMQCSVDNWEGLL